MTDDEMRYAMTETRGTGLIIQVTYDHEARAQYQRMSDLPIARTDERPDGSLVDLAADDSVVGIERLL